LVETIDWFNIYSIESESEIAEAISTGTTVLVDKDKVPQTTVPASLPMWYPDYDTNIHMTLEWVFRKTRKGDLITSTEPILHKAKDGWYTKSWVDRGNLHVCNPTRLLEFRNQYDSLYLQYKSFLKESTGCIVALSEYIKLKEMLSSKWFSLYSVVGYDGFTFKSFPQSTDLEEDEGRSIFLENDLSDFECVKCRTRMPVELEYCIKLLSL
jgi:hypothetical protein